MNYEPILELDSDGLRMVGSCLAVRFDSRFEKQLSKLIHHLQELRTDIAPNSYEELTIFGIAPGHSRRDVERSYGAAYLENTSYQECYDFRTGDRFDLERLCCSYEELQVDYYQDEIDQRVLTVFGSQVESNGILLFTTADTYDPNSPVFAWRRWDWTDPWETRSDNEGWYRLQPSQGFFRLDGNRNYKEFRLSSPWGYFGKRVPPLILAGPFYQKSRRTIT